MGALTDSLLLRLVRPFSRILVGSTPQETWVSQKIGPGLRWTNDAANQQGILDLDPAATVDSIEVTGDLVVDGTFTQGPATTSASTSITTADAVVPLLELDLPTGSVARIMLDIVATDGAREYSCATSRGDVVRTLGGTGGASITLIETSLAAKALAFPPTVSIDWAAGTLTITGMGPSVTVVGTADNGGGRVRVQIGAGPPLGTVLTGKSVTGVGITGTTEANGAHTATWVDATHFDLLAVSFSNAWISGGTFTLTTPPTLTWASYALLLTATPPP